MNNKEDIADLIAHIFFGDAVGAAVILGAKNALDRSKLSDEEKRRMMCSIIYGTGGAIAGYYGGEKAVGEENYTLSAKALSTISGLVGGSAIGYGVAVHLNKNNGPDKKPKD